MQKAPAEMLAEAQRKEVLWLSSVYLRSDNFLCRKYR